MRTRPWERRLVVKIEARSLKVGDVIDRQGEATTVTTTHDGKVFARVGKTALLYRPEEMVGVVLEDEGRG